MIRPNTFFPSPTTTTVLLSVLQAMHFTFPEKQKSIDLVSAALSSNIVWIRSLPSESEEAPNFPSRLKDAAVTTLEWYKIMGGLVSWLITATELLKYKSLF